MDTLKVFRQSVSLVYVVAANVRLFILWLNTHI